LLKTFSFLLVAIYIFTSFTTPFGEYHLFLVYGVFPHGSLLEPSFVFGNLLLCNT